MVFCALFSLLLTCLMLFLDISHIALMFPFNWGKVVSIYDWFLIKCYIKLIYNTTIPKQNAYLYLSMGLFFVVGASLLLHMVLYAESFMWVPRHTKDTLFVSAVCANTTPKPKTHVLIIDPMHPTDYRLYMRCRGAGSVGHRHLSNSASSVPSRAGRRLRGAVPRRGSRNEPDEPHERIGPAEPHECAQFARQRGYSPPQAQSQLRQQPPTQSQQPQ